MILPNSTLQSVTLLQSLRFAFRDTGNALVRAQPEAIRPLQDDARARIGALLEGRPSLDESGALEYPLRAARRFVGGEAYGAARFFALERNFLARASYLKGLNAGETPVAPSVWMEPPVSERTIPSPPLTRPVSRPPSFEECRDMIERAAELATSIPEELRFVDLTRGEVRESRQKNRTLAAKVIDLPMKTVLERIFSRRFAIGENLGEVPGFWAEKVTLEPSLPINDKPSVRISCHLASVDELRAFVIAVQSLLSIPNPIEIVLEGQFEWRGGSLYIPLTPTRLSGGVIPADTIFGTVTPILVPIAEDRTVLAIDMEDKLLSRNPGVFVEAMARGMT